LAALEHWSRSPRRLWDALGPGVITGAADDDPSGIATYSQAGAQFGYALTWTVFLTVPFMAAIQIVSASIGWQTRAGLARSIARRFPRPVLHGLLVLLVAANTLNIAADLAAMGEALRLAIAGPAVLYALAFGLGCLLAEILIPYHRYVGYLKFLTLVLFVYVAAALSLRLPWPQILLAALLPRLSGGHDWALTIVAVFGTTISPYLFFWQASQEAEESRLSLRRGRRSAALPQDLRRISVDTWIGMLFSNLIAFFIIVTTGATLHVHGITHIATASQAAQALRPFAGALTFGLFAAGIIGTGLLAVPVLAGSAAYAVADSWGLAGSLELPAGRARGFYAIVATATVAGGALVLARVDPIAMLFWTAVVNGLVAVPIMLVMMLLTAGPGRFRALAISRPVKVLGWLATVMMALAAGALAWTSVI